MRIGIRGLITVGLLVAGLLLAIPRPALYPEYHTSQAIYDHQGRLLRLTLSTDDKYRLRTTLNRISPLLVDATLLYEDRYFYRHHGLNPVSLLKAAWTTYVLRTQRIGASTITMQLARLRFKIKSHTLGGKLLQILRALQLEWHYNKDEILEAYLNYAPYGGNIEGITSASLIYFDKMPDKLTLHEAITLAVIPQSPAYRSLDKDSGNPGLLAAREELIQRWMTEHEADNDKLVLLRLPVQARSRKELPFLAPHFVESLLADTSSQYINTTLDLTLQTLLEVNIRSYIESQQSLGISNACALLIDYRDMSVKAMLGSADYHNDAIHGQVNGTSAIRSPGSALKPFIYALGMEQGLIHPNSMLKDTQSSYGAYNPENFDNEFSGPIGATAALIRSRNVPAVRIASQLAQPDLYDFLKQANVYLPEDKNHYGLSLVLGGAEISMQSLVRLYAMLANKGELKSVKMTTNSLPLPTQHLLSEASSWLTYKMLTENTRPEQNYQDQWLRNPLPVAWKTGTSYGYRDAWSVGIFGPYVLAVWVGNFNGQGNPALVGRKMAGPLFFNLVDAVRASVPQITDYQLSPPATVKQVKVCALSGHIPGKVCPIILDSEFIPGVSPINKCEIHRQVAIDIKTGLRACRDTPHSRKEVYEFWSSDLLAVFKEAGIARRLPPPYLPHCQQYAVSTVAGVKPAISSPYTHVDYYMRTGQTMNKSDEIPLTAITDADVRHVYWFANEEYLGKTSAQKPLFWKMRPGEFKLRVIDDHGRSDVRQLNVVLTQ